MNLKKVKKLAASLSPDSDILCRSWVMKIGRC